jgi:hypothetical protein
VQFAMRFLAQRPPLLTRHSSAALQFTCMPSTAVRLSSSFALSLSLRLYARRCMEEWRLCSSSLPHATVGERRKGLNFTPDLRRRRLPLRLRSSSASATLCGQTDRQTDRRADGQTNRATDLHSDVGQDAELR